MQRKWYRIGEVKGKKGVVNVGNDRWMEGKKEVGQGGN